jgi:hypothetical protein
MNATESEDGFISLAEFNEDNAQYIGPWLEQNTCRDLTIYAIGNGVPVIKRVVLVEPVRFRIFNDGNILQTLKNSLVSLNEQAVEIQASADADKRSFSPEEASELDGIFANIDFIKAEISRRERAGGQVAPYARVGAKLVEQGYAAIPIIPGTKRPGVNGVGMTAWSELTHADIEEDVDRWSSTSAGVGVLCEIKIDPQAPVVAFGQAIAYRLFSTKTYIAMPTTLTNEDQDRLESLCMLFGVGLALFELNKDAPAFSIRVRAQRFLPDMFFVNQFAEGLKASDVKKTHVLSRIALFLI